MNAVFFAFRQTRISFILLCGLTLLLAWKFVAPSRADEVLPAPDWSIKDCPSATFTQRRSVSQDDVKVEDVVFKGCYDTFINAYLVGPSNASKGAHPGVLFVHWYEPLASNSNREQFLAEAKTLAKSGVVSLLVSTFWSEPGGSYKQRRWQEDRDNTIRQTRDLLQALRVLRSLPEVDRTRVGYVGHDYGATFGGMLAGIDNQVKAFVLIAGTPYITEWYMYGSKTGIPDGRAGLIFLNSFKNIEPATLIAKSKSKIFLQFSDKDDYVPKFRAEQFKKAAPPDALQRIYDAKHDMNLPQIERDRREWLAKTLGFNLKP